MREPLSPEDRERLERLFERAADLTPPERATFLEEECAGNEPLRAELAWLLAGLAGKDRLESMQQVLPARVGTRIGPYHLLEKIGEGGMGEVYAAEQREPVTRRVALKVIKPGMDSVLVIARFEAERQALARMAHPNIAQVFDAGATEEGLPFFVMELVAGVPITEYCDGHKLSTRERLELFLAICAGVQHAHQKGIIHRDLKPSNLLVMRQDARAVPKIIDFGVARATTGRLAERTLHTVLGQIVGTLDYMSPEQADPTALEIDTRTDIYSLGVVLYQLVSGFLPFDHATSAGLQLSEVQRTIREVDPPTPSLRLRRQTGTATRVARLHGTDERTLVRQLAGDLDWICLKALEKDPARRYASASELAEDVRRHLAYVPVLAGRPGPLYRAKKFVRRNRVAVTAGALVAGAGLAGIIGIVSGRLQAAARGDEVLRLSALQKLDDLVAEADGLWPAGPENLERFDSWLARSAELVAELPEHEATLAELTEEIATRSERTLAEEQNRWWHIQLTKLVERLRGFTDPASGLTSSGSSKEHGWGVLRRRHFAASVAERTVTGPEAAALWRAAAARSAASTRYAGLSLSPQLGLVPIGPDPASGLEEFAHLQTGTVPVRDESGRLTMSEETGLVLVLLPGGAFWMGAQSSDPTGPNHDPNAWEIEMPVHRVILSPFFLSKYEMTQGQWQRSTGHNPSRLEPGASPLPEDTAASPLDLLHPVESVDWVICSILCTRLGLSLPSESRWEYAARAGTTSVWWTGDEEKSLLGATNLAPAWLEDGHGVHARVGSYAANGFGLHDVIGNVWEWCLDGYDPTFYALSPEKDPLLVLPAEENHLLRGGGYGEPTVRARSAIRRIVSSELSGGAIGFRPARDLR